MKVLICMSLFLTAAVTHAGICKMVVDRKACPGKEAAAYEPYKNKGTQNAGGITKSNPTPDDKPAKDLAECKKLAEKASKIQRKGILSEKTVTSTFDGKDAGTYSDKPGC